MEVFIGNLPSDITRQEISNLLSAHGGVSEVFHQANMTFGFAQMTDESAASAAISALHGSNLRGRKLILSRAKHRTTRRVNRLG